MVSDRALPSIHDRTPLGESSSGCDRPHPGLRHRARSHLAGAIVLVCLAGVVSCSDDVAAPGAVTEARGSTAVAATSAPAGTTTGVREPEPIESGRGDGLVIPQPVTCMPPGQSSEFALTNPTDVEIGFGPYALFFDDYPSRQTGRIMGVANAGRRLSEQQPPGVVELPAIEFVPLPAGDTMMLTVIAPPEERTWTLIIATAALGQPYDHEGELVMPIQVSVTC
jgi:hypothetical protein